MIPPPAEPLDAEEVWFKIGQMIKDADGKDHPMTVAAKSRLQFDRAVEKGWTPANPKKATEIYAQWIEEEQRNKKEVNVARWGATARNPWVPVDKGRWLHNYQTGETIQIHLK